MSGYKVQEVSAAEFLSLKLSTTVRNKLKAIFEDSNYYGVLAVNDKGKIKAIALEEEPEEYPDNTIDIAKIRVKSKAMSAKSKTAKAIDLIENGMTPYAAAKKLGIGHSAVYTALARRKNKRICPCCKQVVREGYRINRKVLKEES